MTTTAAPDTVLNEFLEAAFDAARIEEASARLVAEDATYVSLNFDDPELNTIMPWAGTKQGRAAFVSNFLGVVERWTVEGFESLDTLVDGQKVALFGRFTLRSVTLGKSATSPMAVLAKVVDGRITYFQYMEDTFATARTFRSGGEWQIDADPNGEPFAV